MHNQDIMTYLDVEKCNESCSQLLGSLGRFPRAWSDIAKRMGSIKDPGTIRPLLPWCVPRTEVYYRRGAGDPRWRPVLYLWEAEAGCSSSLPHRGFLVVVGSFDLTISLVQRMGCC